MDPEISPASDTPRTPPASRRRLSWSEWLALAEAMLALILASVAVMLIPFRILMRSAAWGRTGCSRRIPEEAATARRTGWAVRACARRVPWRAVCFQQGLAAQWMLRRRGLPSVLYYGAAPDEAKGLSAHVWVCLGEINVTGAESAGKFAILAKFPAT